MAQVNYPGQMCWTQQPVTALRGDQTARNEALKRGSKWRVITGGVLVACGVVDIIFGIALLCLPFKVYYSYNYGSFYESYNRYYGYEHSVDLIDNVAWGIWIGVPAIVTGSFGLSSRKKKCLIITYMVLAIITATLAANGFISNCIGIARTVRYRSHENTIHADAHLAMYILAAITYAIQLAACVVGASLSCKGVCCRPSSTQQVIYYQPPSLSHEQLMTTGPYTIVTAPNNPYPNQQFPNQQFPNQQFPNQQLPNQQFPNQQFPNQQFPNQQFPNQQFPNQQSQPPPYSTVNLEK